MQGTLDSEKLYCVYVAIGHKCSTMAQLVKILLEAGALEYRIIVAAILGTIFKLCYGKIFSR